jgi:hypothetical protein
MFVTWRRVEEAEEEEEEEEKEVEMVEEEEEERDFVERGVTGARTGASSGVGEHTLARLLLLALDTRESGVLGEKSMAESASFAPPPIQLVGSNGRSMPCSRAVTSAQEHKNTRMQQNNIE